MKFVTKLLALPFAVAVFSFQDISVQAAELTGAEAAVWNALETQIGLGRSGGDASAYIHPEMIPWGPNTPVPAVRSGLNQIARQNSNVVNLSHSLTPITVKVVGNTAIINALLIVLEKEGDAEPTRRRTILHNTWINEGGQWRLLATYNTAL